MNHKQLILWGGVILSLSVSMLTSCQKEETMQQTVNNSADQAVLERILAFKTDVENPAKLKTNQTISVDEAVWNIEAALNYTYCIALAPEKYEGCELISDSIEIPFLITNNNAYYQDAINAYVSINQTMQQYYDNLNYSFKKYYVADVEVKESTIICKYSIFVKNTNKSINVYPDLDFDWRTGAGGCDAGRCDGTHPEKNANSILTNYLNYALGRPANSFFTSITSGMQFWAGVGYSNNIYGCDTLLYQTYATSEAPCITSSQMKKLFSDAILLTSRYNAPIGWMKASLYYEIGKQTIQGGIVWYSTYYVINIGVPHTINPSE